MPAPSLFDQVGETTLRNVVKDFYDHVFNDAMIGFFFVGKNKAHLIDREYEMAARMLGGDVRYTGKPMREAHQAHKIFGGHFERRMQLLKEALDRHNLPAEVKRVWLEHTRSLRSQITRDPNSHCGSSD